MRTAAFIVPLMVSGGAWPEAMRPSVRGAVGSTAVLGMGRSVGSPTAGHLVGGSRLGDAPYLRIVPAYSNGEVRWGLGSLVGMIDRAAARVRKAHPDSVLSVGHLSRHGGGEVDRHVSHESGRDADIGFYVRSAQGKPLLAEHFVAFRGDGSAPSWPGAFFDDARNWALVRALLTDTEARVTHIFVATPLRARLLAYAAKINAPVELRQRAALAMLQPRGALPHDDHFHVRISCPSWQRECVEIAMRKKPALVAKVPTPKMRARSQTGVLAQKHDKHDRDPTSSVAKADGPSRAPTSGPWPAGHGSSEPARKIPTTHGEPPLTGIERAAEAVVPPAARMHTPLVREPDQAAGHRDEAIDDVDGPM